MLWVRTKAALPELAPLAVRHTVPRVPTHSSPGRCWKYPLPFLMDWWLEVAMLPGQPCAQASAGHASDLTSEHQGKLDLRLKQTNSYCLRSISFSFPTFSLCFSWNSLAASSCNKTCIKSSVQQWPRKTPFPLNPLNQMPHGPEKLLSFMSLHFHVVCIPVAQNSRNSLAASAQNLCCRLTKDDYKHAKLSGFNYHQVTDVMWISFHPKQISDYKGTFRLNLYNTQGSPLQPAHMYQEGSS